MNPSDFVAFIWYVILEFIKLGIRYVLPFVGLIVLGIFFYRWKLKPKKRDDLAEIKKGAIRIAKRNKINSYEYLKDFYRVEVDVQKDILQNSDMNEEGRSTLLKSLKLFTGGIPVGKIVGFTIMDLIVTEEDLVTHQVRIKKKERKPVNIEELRKKVKEDLRKAGDKMYIVVYKKKLGLFSSFESPVLLLDEQISDYHCKSGNLACYGFGFQPFAGFEIVSGDPVFRDIFTLQFRNWSGENASFSIISSTTDLVRKSTGMDTEQQKVIDMAEALGGIKRGLSKPEA